MDKTLRVLVTGATGFLGGRLCRRLLEDGGELAETVEVIGCGRNPKIGQALADAGVRFERANLSDRARMIALCEDVDYVFHSGAFSSPWGKYEDFFKANVEGTQNVVDGCREHRVKRLIHVSSPSIYFTGNDQQNIAEDYPIPPPATHYIKTKLLAEKVVDEAHAAGLPVITLRPRALFGPGDTAIFPRLLKSIEAKRLPIIGDGKNIVDLTYIDNVVDSLLCAAKAADEHLGKKYNISNGTPTSLWALVERVALALELPPPTKRISVPFALAVATLLEFLHRTVLRGSEPRLTRYSVAVLSRNITLDIRAAKHDLGFEPRVSIDEGIERYVTWYRTQR